MGDKNSIVWGALVLLRQSITAAALGVKLAAF